MKMSKGKIIGVALLVFIVVGLLPSTRDELHWRWASLQDKTHDYAGYLTSWPTGRHLADAKSRYDERGWSDAQSASTVAGYLHYEQAHPDGAYLQEARIRIESLELNQALVATSPAPLREFLKKYPNSSHVETAQRQLTSMEDAAWQHAKQNGKIDSYKHYLGDHPDGRHVDEAKARILIFEFDSGFGKSVTFTGDQMRAFMESLEKETYSTQIQKPLEYYEIETVGRCEVRKGKVVVNPSPDKKACSLQLESGNLSITAYYVSTPSHSPITRPLFPEKWQPTMTHNGCAGPGLEIDTTSDRGLSEFKRFLDTFSIFYRIREYTTGDVAGYVIPDLVWRSDERGSSYPHYGASFTIKHKNGEIIPRVNGVKGMPKTAITSYKQALALKTYLQIRGNE